jgi:hypothetical protein
MSPQPYIFCPTTLRPIRLGSSIEVAHIDRLIQEAEEHIAEQRDRITEDTHAGRDPASAEQLLAVMVENLARMQAHRRTLRRNGSHFRTRYPASTIRE